MLVIVAISLTVLLGSAALAIDLGSFYAAQKRAQVAADAAALAAAQDLPSNTSAASTDATTYAEKNYPGATVTVATDYGSNSGSIKVTVNGSAPTFLSQIWGQTSQHISASAVAGANPVAVDTAIFAYDDACSDTGIALDGNSPDISGGIYSNGVLTQDTNPHTSLGPAWYGGPNDCSYNNDGKGTFSAGPTSTYTPSSTATPFPTDFRNDPSPCDDPPSVNGSPLKVVSGTPDIDFTANNSTIAPGVYCASSEITISGQHISASNVMFIAPSITVSGNNMTLSAPSSNSLLFWYSGTGTFILGGTGNSMSLSGDIFAPSATVEFTGNTASGSTGFIEANDVIIDGNSFNWSGTGPSIASSAYSLLG